MPSAAIAVPIVSPMVRVFIMISPDLICGDVPPVDTPSLFRAEMSSPIPGNQGLLHLPHSRDSKIDGPRQTVGKSSTDMIQLPT